MRFSGYDHGTEISGSRRLDDDADFLGELATQRIERRLAGIALAARKFPETREVLAGGTLRDEHAAVRVADDAGDDVDGRRRSSCRC